MPKIDLPDSPGPWTLQVIPYTKDDPQQFLVTNTGHSPEQLVHNPGWSLTDFRKKLGGDEGSIEDPEGQLHHFSLKPWAGTDPEAQRFRVQFVGPTRHDPNVTSHIR